MEYDLVNNDVVAKLHALMLIAYSPYLAIKINWIASMCKTNLPLSSIIRPSESEQKQTNQTKQINHSE